MKLQFPSAEFDAAVAGVCHDFATDQQIRALNELLRNNRFARDEYILRLELHSRMASEPDLFSSSEAGLPVIASSERLTIPRQAFPPQAATPSQSARKIWTVALAACMALLAAGLWNSRPVGPSERAVTTSKAVAMLNRTVNAKWNRPGEAPRLNAPLDPGWLRLESGLAEVVFYSGARLVLRGRPTFSSSPPVTHCVGAGALRRRFRRRRGVFGSIPRMGQ